MFRKTVDLWNEFDKRILVISWINICLGETIGDWIKTPTNRKDDWKGLTTLIKVMRLVVAWCELNLNDCLQFKIVFKVQRWKVSSSYLQVFYKEKIQNYRFVAMDHFWMAFRLFSWLSRCWPLGSFLWPLKALLWFWWILHIFDGNHFTKAEYIEWASPNKYERHFNRVSLINVFQPK